MAKAPNHWLFQKPREPRRHRCVLCGELTHSTYQVLLGAVEKPGFRCEKCKEIEDERIKALFDHL